MRFLIDFAILLTPTPPYAGRHLILRPPNGSDEPRTGGEARAVVGIDVTVTPAQLPSEGPKPFENSHLQACFP